MKKLKLILCSLAALSLVGCMSGNAKRFFAENKSYTFEKVNISFSTPWGSEVISADKISSQVVYPLGATNGPLIVPAGGTLTTVTPVTVTPANKLPGAGFSAPVTH